MRQVLPRALTILAGLSFAVASCHGHGDVESVLALEGDPVAGETIFNDTCATAACHGPGGTDGAAPELGPLVRDHDDEDVAGVVKYGDGDMPAQDLTDQEIADVLAYVRDLYGSE